MSESISKQKIKWIRSLAKKKIRDREQLFVAEGQKIVSELLLSHKCRLMVRSDKTTFIASKSQPTPEQIVVADSELKKISNLKTPQGILAIFEKPQTKYEEKEIVQNLSLFLEDIQDPGNLGTIVRLADWFDIKNIFCSNETVDIFNPKTVQATMGAIARVKVHYVDKYDFLQEYSDKTTLFGTFLEGENIYQADLPQSGIIILGNEGNGISKEVKYLVNRQISIPSFPNNSSSTESLNVGIATGIVVSEFRRRKKI